MDPALGVLTLGTPGGHTTNDPVRSVAQGTTGRSVTCRPSDVQSSSTTWWDDYTDDDNVTSSAAVPMTMTNVRKIHASEPIQFIQLNLQHSQSASTLLCKQVGNLCSVIALIQEPWVNQTRILGLNSKGCSIIRGCINSHPKTCMLTKGVRTMNLPQFGNEDITTLSLTYMVNNQDRTMIIASVYMAIELLYADDLVVIAETEDLIKRLNEWKDFV